MKHFKINSALIFLLISLLFPSKLFAQSPGSRDTSFGNNGFVKTLIGNSATKATSIIIQPDGKIVAAGYFYNIEDDLVLVRYNTDGSLDNSFGNAGIQITYLESYVSSISSVLQADGKILIATDYGSSILLIRYLSNGQLDINYGVDGKFFFNPLLALYYRPHIKLENDGNLLVGCSSYVNDTFFMTLFRLDSNGGMVESFGDNGIVKFLIEAGSGIYDMVEDSLSRIIVCGSASPGQSFYPYIFLTRFNSNGIIDSTFAVKGVLLLKTFEMHPYYSGTIMQLQQDGKILIGGYKNILYYDFDFAVARFDSNGKIDSTFGNNGIAVTSFGPYDDEATGIALQQDGKIILSGFTAMNDNNYTNYAFALARYNTNGIIDSAFGIDGKVIDDLGINSSSSYAVAVQPDGKIVATGEADGYFTTARYLSGLNVGILNIKVSDAPPLIYPNPIKSNATLEYTLRENENLTTNLFDIEGRQVQTFITNQNRNAGQHKEELFFDAALPSGNYVLQISNGVHQQRIKIIL